jgi:NTE family protein
VQCRDGTKTPVCGISFAGGLALASYHAGVIEAFLANNVKVDWVSGSSAGAVTAALVAGGEPENAMRRLASFWGISGAAQMPDADPWAHFRAWTNVARSHVLGNARHFYPRLPTMTGFKSLYDLGEMRRRLVELVDFERLNAGTVRVSIAATDLATGDPVIFDTAAEKLGIDHFLASCGFLPEFAPVEIGGRVLVDGGLSVNTPFDLLLASDFPIDLYVVDLFARDGVIPASLERAAERKTDLMFANQTYLRLQLQLELRSLRHPEFAPSDRVTYMSYRSGPTEPGPEKSFNFSPDGLARRWREGLLDAEAALATQGERGFRTVRR